MLSSSARSVAICSLWTLGIRSAPSRPLQWHCRPSTHASSLRSYHAKLSSNSPMLLHLLPVHALARVCPTNGTSTSSWTPLVALATYVDDHRIRHPLHDEARLRAAHVDGTRPSLLFDTSKVQPPRTSASFVLRSTKEVDVRRTRTFVALCSAVHAIQGRLVRQLRLHAANEDGPRKVGWTWQRGW